METQGQEEVWSGPAISNPKNVTVRGWKRAGVADQSPALRDALVLGTSFLNESVLRTEDAAAIVLTGLECLSTIGHGEGRLHRFLGWAPLRPEGRAYPANHWRLAYLIDAHDDGAVDITAVHVAPDHVAHHGRPKIALPA